MARIRSIKPETFADELLGALPREVLLLYIGIWTVCDDDGRFRANPAFLRSTLFPYAEDLTQHEVGTWLNTLAEKERVLLYEFAGQQYGWVIRWLQHQKIDHPSPSRLPAPPKTDKRKSGQRAGKSSRGSREVLANPREPLATDQEGIGVDQEGSTSVAVPATPPQQRVLIPAEAPRERGTTKASDGSSEHRLFVEWWVSRFEALFEAKYAFNGGKDGRIVKTLLDRAGGLDALKQRAEAFLTSDDPWYAEKGRDLGLFMASWNRFASAGRSASNETRDDAGGDEPRYGIYKPFRPKAEPRTGKT